MAHWGSCDFSQLQALQQRMERSLGNDYQTFCESCAKEIAARLLAKVIKRTVVGASISHDEDVLDENGNAVTYKRNSKNHRQGEVKRRTVTDHIGGTLRRGWTSKTHEEAASGHGNGKNAREYANGLRVIKSGGAYTITVQNPVLYAAYVEYGHRQTPGRYVPALGKKLKQAWVKGQFMLTISENEIRANMDKIIEKKLAVYMGEMLGGN